MVRQLVRLDSNNTSQSVNLPFDAEVLSVINPTAQSIGVSVGGNIIPQSIGASDVWIPADSGINYPVVGRNFAVGFMPPFLVNAPTGIPTAANLFFTAQESVPNFGAFPLSTLATQALADAILIPKTNPPGTVYTLTLDITPDVVSLTLLLATVGQNITSASVQGKDSGLVYWQSPAGNLANLTSWNMPFYGGVDSGVTVFVFYTNAGPTNLVYLLGHRERNLLTVRKDGSLLTTANPSWLNAPAYSSHANVVAPAAFATITSVTVVIGGLYRIEAEIFSDDTPAIGKRVVMVINGGNVGMYTVGTATRDVLSVVSIDAGQVVLLQTGGAAGPGTLYYGALRLYAI